MIIGYIRVSTAEQNEDTQHEELSKYNCEKIFEEKVSGKNINDRTQLNLMLDFIREGDILVIKDLSRLARNTKDLLTIIELLELKKVKLISCRENINTSTASGKLMITMLGAFYEFERNNLLEKQRLGIQLAKEQGKYKGRKSKKKPNNWNELLEQYNTRKINKTEFARLCNVSRVTLDKWLKK